VGKLCPLVFALCGLEVVHELMALCRFLANLPLGSPSSVGITEKLFTAARVSDFET